MYRKYKLVRRRYGNDAAPKPEEVTFTDAQQAKINAILADEKRKNQEKLKSIETELEKSKGAIKDKETLNTQLEELKRSFMSKEELAKADAEKQKNQYESDLTAAKSQASQYRGLFENNLAERSILDAASEHKAFNAQQIALLLKNQSKVIAETNDAGETIGYKVIVPVEVNGKMIELPVKDAVAKYRENPAFANLFLVDGTGGTGKTINNTPGATGSTDSGPPNDPAAFREWRKKQSTKG